jgi:hypothetical protein
MDDDTSPGGQVRPGVADLGLTGRTPGPRARRLVVSASDPTATMWQRAGDNRLRATLFRWLLRDARPRASTVNDLEVYPVVLVRPFAQFVTGRDRDVLFAEQVHAIHLAAVRDRAQVILDLRGQVLALESAREDNPDIPFGGQEGTWQSFLYTGTECLEIPALITPGRYRSSSGQDIRGDAQPSQLAAQVLKLVVPVPAP